MNFKPTETFDGYYMIGIFENKLILSNDYKFNSSYNVIGARLLGLSYPDYLCYCRAGGAKLKGKTGYAYPIWSDKNKCNEICNLLNHEMKRVEEILLLRNDLLLKNS